jgi:hypothetical protein
MPPYNAAAVWGGLRASAVANGGLSSGVRVTGNPVVMYVGRFKIGKEVAILPTGYAAAHEVIDIAVVEYVSSAYLQLTDGRIYDPATGRRLGGADSTYVTPANDEHRVAITARMSQLEKASDTTAQRLDRQGPSETQNPTAIRHL